MKNKRFNYLVAETKNGKVVNLWADEYNTEHIGGNIEHMPVYKIRNKYHEIDVDKDKDILTVLCKETGYIFPSLSSAAKHFGVSPYLIEQSIKHNNPVGGYNFEYATLSDFINNK